MPAIASTGAMLFTGHKGTSGKSALARRTESSTRVANTAVRRQVSGTSDCTSRRNQLLFIELFDSGRERNRLSRFPLQHTLRCKPMLSVSAFGPWHRLAAVHFCSCWRSDSRNSAASSSLQFLRSATSFLAWSGVNFVTAGGEYGVFVVFLESKPIIRQSATVPIRLNSS